MFRALATFGVGHGRVDLERSALAPANDFRQAFCLLYQEYHEAVINWRNRTFPELFAAMVASEHLRARIDVIEAEIKAHHSDVRDRNAVTVEQRADLGVARAERAALQVVIVREKKRFYDAMHAFSAYWNRLADWKNVKSLVKRQQRYATVTFPTTVEPYYEALVAAEAALAVAKNRDPEPVTDVIEPAIITAYGAIWMAFDLRQRSLSAEYSPTVHSAVRGEIVKASLLKKSKTSPGIRYKYGRVPRPRAWQNLTLQFSRGLTFTQLLSGKSRQLRVVEWRRNERSGDVYYKVQQQIGTAKNPLIVNYVLIADFPIPQNSKINRWTLIVHENGKREVVITMDVDGVKPSGLGAFAYRLSWTVRKAGIEVARFWGNHVNERLLLSHRLVQLRMATKAAQTLTDNRANVFLTSCGHPPQPNQVQGVQALIAYTEVRPLDNAAANLLHECQLILNRAKRTTDRAIGCIEKIYETVASRVCRLHSEVNPHDIDLREIKLYDKRDLLREDVLPERSRELLFACAPGKLKALLNGYGLASTEVEPPEPDGARETDLFRTYVASIRGRDRSNRGGRRHRSQRDAYQQAS